MRKEYFDLKELDDAVLRLAALGLLEIAGKTYRAEFDATYPDKIVEMPSTDKIDQIERAITREERREKLGKIQRVIVPIVTKAAVVFFVFFLGFSTVLITSADAREFFYQLVFTVHDRYSEVVIPEKLDEEMSKACYEYEVAYIPDGYQCSYEASTPRSSSYVFSNDENSSFNVMIIELSDSSDQTVRFDTENTDSIQPVVINNSLGLMILKEEYTQIVWQKSNVYFSVESALPSEIVIQIAQGII